MIPHSEQLAKQNECSCWVCKEYRATASGYSETKHNYYNRPMTLNYQQQINEGDLPVIPSKKVDIQKAVNQAKAVVVRLRAMKKSRNKRELDQWRKALAIDMNHLNYLIQTL